MQVDDEVLVANEVALAMGATERIGMPIDMVGDLVQLVAVHYGIDYIPRVSATMAFIAGLSSNPEHQYTAPADNADFMTNRAIYGRFSFVDQVAINGINYGLANTLPSHEVPLYGIIRPSRQAIVVYNTNPGGVANLFIEVYYRRVFATQTERNYYNDILGRYRRD